MGSYTQRKRFDDRELAERQAQAFHAPAFQRPGVNVSTNVAEERGYWWLYVTHDGPLVTDNAIILPEYERVL